MESPRWYSYVVAKWAGLSSLPDLNGWAAIAVAVMGGRLAAVASMAAFRYENSDGLGTPFRGHRTDRVLGCGRICG